MPNDVTCPGCGIEFSPLFPGASKHVCPSCRHVFEEATGPGPSMPEGLDRRTRVAVLTSVVALGLILSCGVAGLIAFRNHSTSSRVDETQTSTPRQQKSNALAREAWESMRKQDWPKALIKATESLEVDPSNNEALFVRGTANAAIATTMENNRPDRGMTRLRNAVEELRRASEKDPDYRKMYELNRSLYRDKAALMGID